jgi:hypothetical protein
MVVAADTTIEGTVCAPAMIANAANRTTASHALLRIQPFIQTLLNI